MILVDTSVWIDFLKGTLDNSPFLTRLIENREALAINAYSGSFYRVRRVREKRK